jgi:hypothetical protein
MRQTMPPSFRGLGILLGLALPARALAADPAPASAVPLPPPAPPRPAPSVPHPFAYGILVGSNAGGHGQADLRWAEEDAKRMADVLRELGRYGTSDLRVLTSPKPSQILAAVDDLAPKLQAHRARGEQAVVVFYYSGHAKANAFHLGTEELPIATLREKLRALPSALTFVVLDACQSGQFARAKGAEPAHDFSFNSVSRLTTKGIAVMASSSAQELSQESDDLRSSYFTHHLIVALRGAGDADGDGRVSLDEAYRYAYRNTLASTSSTAIGGQHVTLETDLAGEGDVSVTYPADGASQLELPADLRARVLVQHRPSNAIVAEVEKAPGSALRLALPSGTYDAIVREPARVSRCSMQLVDRRVTAIDLGACRIGRLGGVAKGDFEEDAPPPPAPKPLSPIAPWQIEAGFGPMWRVDDAYTRTLERFGYRHDANFFGIRPRFRFHAGASRGVLPHLAVGAIFHTLAGDEYRRDVSDSADTYVFDAYGLSGFARGFITPIGGERRRSFFLELYAQAAIGLALGISTLQTGSASVAFDRRESTERQIGWTVGAHGGIALGGGPIAFFLQAGREYAPAFENLTGDVHDSGGWSTQLGMRARFE